MGGHGRAPAGLRIQPAPPPLPGGAPYPLHSCNLPAGADPPCIGTLHGGHGEADEEKHLSLLQAGSGGALSTSILLPAARPCSPGQVRSRGDGRFSMVRVARAGVSPEAGGQAREMAGRSQARSFKGPAALPAEQEALVGKEAERVLQSREQEEVEEIHQAQAAEAPESWGAVGKGLMIAAGGWGSWRR